MKDPEKKGELEEGGHRFEKESDQELSPEGLRVEKSSD